MIQAAVLTISDSVHRGSRLDLSGPAVRERLEQLGWSVAANEVLPDEADAIAGRLATLADGNQLSTPLAALSRSFAGTRGRVLIVNLPGSPQGAVESLNAIVDLVPHILELLRGQTDHSGIRN